MLPFAFVVGGVVGEVVVVVVGSKAITTAIVVVGFVGRCWLLLLWQS